MSAFFFITFTEKDGVMHVAGKVSVDDNATENEIKAAKVTADLVSDAIKRAKDKQDQELEKP